MCLLTVFFCTGTLRHLGTSRWHHHRDCVAVCLRPQRLVSSADLSASSVSRHNRRRRRRHRRHRPQFHRFRIATGRRSQQCRRVAGVFSSLCQPTTISTSTSRHRRAGRRHTALVLCEIEGWTWLGATHPPRDRRTTAISPSLSIGSKNKK